MGDYIDGGYTPERTNLNHVLSRENVAMRLGVSRGLDDFPAILWPVVDEAVARTREDYSVVSDGSISEIDYACRSYGNVLVELSNMKSDKPKGGII